MSVKLEKTFSFQAGVHFQDKFLMNLYDFTLSMEVLTDCIIEQNIAMERIKYFLFDCLENSIFVNEKEKKVIDNYSTAGIKVCTVPDDPYDQIIATILLLKLRAITESRLLITDIYLVSKLSDDVKFWLEIDDIESMYTNEGWWNKSSTCITDAPKSNKKDKILKLFNNTEWNDVGLHWKTKPTSAEVTFIHELTEK
jgi:hypothetical protein